MSKPKSINLTEYWWSSGFFGSNPFRSEVLWLFQWPFNLVDKVNVKLFRAVALECTPIASRKAFAGDPLSHERPSTVGVGSHQSLRPAQLCPALASLGAWTCLSGKFTNTAWPSTCSHAGFPPDKNLCVDGCCLQSWSCFSLQDFSFNNPSPPKRSMAYVYVYVSHFHWSRLGYARQLSRCLEGDELRGVLSRKLIGRKDSMHQSFPRSFPEPTELKKSKRERALN